MRIIHSADWQLGTRFRRFGGRAGWLRKTRIETLERALALAAQRSVGAFIIAGDLFEDHGVEASLLNEVWQAFAGKPSVPIYIVPGNHDPANGPAAIWARKPFANPPSNVRIFTEASAVQLECGAWLLGSPLRQKRSTVDPSLELDALVATLPAGDIKVGITHGCPAVEGLYEADDFPIARNAATRAGLDYLAIGHWHGYQVFDHGRMVMPGTPEQTDFSENNPGSVIEVEIKERGAEPVLTVHRIGSLQWQRWDCEVTDADHGRAAVEQFARGLAIPGKSVLRVLLKGNASPAVVTELTDLLHSQLSTCAILEVLDETTPEVTAAELATLQSEHPLLGAVLEDLDQLAEMPSPAVAELCEQLNCDPDQVTREVLVKARHLLLMELQNLESAC